MREGASEPATIPSSCSSASVSAMSAVNSSAWRVGQGGGSSLRELRAQRRRGGLLEHVVGAPLAAVVGDEAPLEQRDQARVLNLGPCPRVLLEGLLVGGRRLQQPDEHRPPARLVDGSEQGRAVARGELAPRR